MRQRTAATAIGLLLVVGLLVAAPSSASAARPALPADPLAGGTATTLLRNLNAAQQPGALDGFLFGQQHANWDSKRYRAVDDSAVEWRGPRVPAGGFDQFASDIEIATTLIPGVDRRRPAVYGFSLRTALRLDAEDRVAYADRIVDAYGAGGVVTIHFPADNPVTGRDHRDVSANALCVLSTDWDDPAAGTADAVRAWQGKLDDAAEFFRLVHERWRDPDGDGRDERSGRVAMVFRPFHEMLRVSHWWSAAHYHSVPGVCGESAAAAFRSLWRQTFDYLVGEDHLDVHGLLFAWSPDRPTAAAEWKAFYPNTDGDRDYVDVIAFDIYEETTEAFSAQLVADASAVIAFNESLEPPEREVVAIGEFGARSGLSTVSEANWFMRSVIQPLANAGLLDRIAYAMTWSNMDSERYWVPLPCFNVPNCEGVPVTDQFYGSGRAGDPLRGFRAFVNHPATVFLEDLPPWWRTPDPTIPFQPGDGAAPVLQLPCWVDLDGVATLETCPLPRRISVAVRLNR